MAKKKTSKRDEKPSQTAAQKAVGKLLRNGKTGKKGAPRAKKAPRGRPLVSAFTKEREARILEALRLGLFRYNAAAIAGVTDRTIKKWMARGRDNLAEIERWEDAEEEGIAEDECPQLNHYGHFVIKVSVAEAAAEAESLLTIQNAGLEDWRAAAWYLERKHNKRYGSGALRTDLPTEDDFAEDDMSEIEAQFLERITTIETRVEKVKRGGAGQ